MTEGSAKKKGFFLKSPVTTDVRKFVEMVASGPRGDDEGSSGSSLHKSGDTSCIWLAIAGDNGCRRGGSASDSESSSPRAASGGGGGGRDSDGGRGRDNDRDLGRDETKHDVPAALCCVGTDDFIGVGRDVWGTWGIGIGVVDIHRPFSLPSGWYRGRALARRWLDGVPAGEDLGADPLLLTQGSTTSSPSITLRFRRLGFDLTAARIDACGLGSRTDVGVWKVMGMGGEDWVTEGACRIGGVAQSPSGATVDTSNEVEATVLVDIAAGTVVASVSGLSSRTAGSGRVSAAGADFLWRLALAASLRLILVAAAAAAYVAASEGNSMSGGVGLPDNRRRLSMILHVR